MPRFFLEFMNAEDISDWLADRPGVDYGPRWPGDKGVRVEAAERREHLTHMLTNVDVKDKELEKLMPKLTKQGEKVGTLRRRKWRDGRPQPVASPPKGVWAAKAKAEAASPPR